MNIFDSPIVLFNRSVILDYLRSSSTSSSASSSSNDSTTKSSSTNSSTTADFDDDRLLRRFFEQFGVVQSIQSISLKSVSRVIVIYSISTEANNAAEFVLNRAELQQSLIGFGKKPLLNSNIHSIDDVSSSRKTNENKNDNEDVDADEELQNVLSNNLTLPPRGRVFLISPPPSPPPDWKPRFEDPPVAHPLPILDVGEYAWLTSPDAKPAILLDFINDETQVERK